MAPTSSSGLLEIPALQRWPRKSKEIPTLPLCSPVPGPHSLSSSLDFVVTLQSHPGLSHGRKQVGEAFCFPVFWALV